MGCWATSKYTGPCVQSRASLAVKAQHPASTVSWLWALSLCHSLLRFPRLKCRCLRGSFSEAGWPLKAHSEQGIECMWFILGCVGSQEVAAGGASKPVTTWAPGPRWGRPAVRSLRDWPVRGELSVQLRQERPAPGRWRQWNSRRHQRGAFRFKTGLHALEQGEQNLPAPHVPDSEAEDGGDEGASWASFLRGLPGSRSAKLSDGTSMALVPRSGEVRGRSAGAARSDRASPLAAPGQMGEQTDAAAPARDCLWGPVSLAAGGDTTFC